MNSATRAGAGEPPPLSTASHHPFVDKSLTCLPKTLGRVVPSGESCLCSRGPEGVGVTHLSGLFFSSQRRDAEQRRARESELCPQGWAQLQCAAGGTEDKTWDSGCCCMSSVVRRMLQGENGKMSGLLSPLFFCSVDGFCGTATGEQQTGWSPDRPPVVFDQFSRRIIIASWWARADVGAGGRGPPAEIASAVPFMQRHSPARIRSTADRGGSEVTRRISTESTDVSAPWAPPSTRKNKRTEASEEARDLDGGSLQDMEAQDLQVPRLQRKHSRIPSQHSSASPRLSPPARSLFLDARPIATRNKKGQKKGRHRFPRAPIDPPPLFCPETTQTTDD